jgi:hypothetical protein
VAALLEELGRMSGDDDPSTGYVHKAVVFSSWGRLLRLVGEALDTNGGCWCYLPACQCAGWLTVRACGDGIGLCAGG